PCPPVPGRVDVAAAWGGCATGGGMRVQRCRADAPHVVGDVDRDSGGTISSMRSSTSADSSILSVARGLSTCSMVRGPMIAEVTEGWRVTNATAPPEG